MLTPDENLDQLEQLSSWRQLERKPLQRFESTLVRLQVPPNLGMEEARARVRVLLPQASIDFNHSYDLGQSPNPATDTGRSRLAGGRYRAPVTVDAATHRVGMIDGGIALEHQAVARSPIRTRSFIGRNRARNMAHGTAVASLLVGQSDKLQGMAPEVELVAAEAFFETRELGLISTGYQLVQALDWLTGEQVEVINMSLAGPANEVLEQVLGLVIDTGIIVVAAVGNDGPGSPPRYPAAYYGVIAVTAIDKDDRVYLRAVRGDHVDFAAPGVDLTMADHRRPAAYRTGSGTSYAAPFVTGLVLHYRALHPNATSFELIEYMHADVIDLGAPGPDEVFGHGVAGASLILPGVTGNRQ